MSEFGEQVPLPDPTGFEEASFDEEIERKNPQNPYPQTPSETRDLVRIRTWLANYDAPKAQPEDVNIFSLPLNWEGIGNLGRAVGELTGNVSTQELTDIKPPEELYPFLPMVTSVIAHNRYPEVPVKLPTAGDIAAIKPWVSRVEKVVDRFSPNLARRFRGYVQGKGQELVIDVGKKAIKTLDALENIPNPQMEFMKEMHWAYYYLAQPSYDSNIESKIYDFISILDSAKYGQYFAQNQHWLNPIDFPILIRLLPQLGIPPNNINANEVSIAGSEVMQGIEVFLRQHGITDIPPAPSPREFDFFDPDTWMRGLAETFASERLDRARDHLPFVLAHAFRAMPTDGPLLADKISGIAKSATDAYYQGVKPKDIAQAMFNKPS